jgi:hypothetical protein
MPQEQFIPDLPTISILLMAGRFHKTRVKTHALVPPHAHGINAVGHRAGSSGPPEAVWTDGDCARILACPIARSLIEQRPVREIQSRRTVIAGALEGQSADHTSPIVWLRSSPPARPPRPAFDRPIRREPAAVLQIVRYSVFDAEPAPPRTRRRRSHTAKKFNMLHRSAISIGKRTLASNLPNQKTTQLH